MDVICTVDPFAEAKQFASRRESPPRYRWPLSKFARKFLRDHLSLGPSSAQNRDWKVPALINTLWSVEAEGPAKFPNARTQRAAWEAGSGVPVDPRAYDEYLHGLVIDFLEKHAPTSYKDEYGALHMLLRDVLERGLAATLNRWQDRSEECSKLGVDLRTHPARYAEEQHSLRSAGLRT